MAIPDFQSLMLPLLKLMQDGQERIQSDIRDALAQQFSVSYAERSELLASGRQGRFNNRVGWAKSYLVMAGLLTPTSRGKCRIANAGQQVLQQKPSKIDIHYLSQYPEFIARRTSRKNNGEDETAIGSIESSQTPEEKMESGYQNLRQSLAQDILAHVKQITPQRFEGLVVDLLVAMGYGGSRSDAGQAVGRSGDGGIDGIIKEDKLGLDAIYIQAKRWEGNVGRPVVQAFTGSLEGQRARKGVLITTSQFTNDALEYVNRIEKKIVLIDGEQLAELMINHGIGVTETATYVVKRIDQDYFTEE